MEPTLGIVLCFDWRVRDAPLRSRSAVPYLSLLDQSGLRVFAVDWRSITAEGLASAVDVRNHHVGPQPLDRMDLLHVCELGAGPGGRPELLREKWDALSAKLAVVERLGLRCVNPVRTLREATRKTYLPSLARAGVPVVPTEVLSARIGLQELLDRCRGRGRMIVKPANGECGRHVCPVESLTQERLDEIALGSDELLLQPFQEEVLQGERSIFILGRRVSHAVLKLPAPGDLRANGVRRGGTVRSYAPDRAEISFAFDAMDAFPYPLDACRVDYVVAGGGPRLMELEAVDPAPYVARDAAWAERMAAFYADLLSPPASGRGGPSPS